MCEEPVAWGRVREWKNIAVITVIVIIIAITVRVIVPLIAVVVERGYFVSELTGQLIGGVYGLIQRFARCSRLVEVIRNCGW